jgi:hypothetical protein
MRIMKTMDKQINEDIATLKGDLHKLREDLAGKRRARRRRESTAVAVGGPEVREAATEAQERPAAPGEHVERPRRGSRVLTIRRHPVWMRVLAVSFVLGAAAAFFLMRRRRVPVAETPSPEREVTAAREESSVQ